MYVSLILPTTLHIRYQVEVIKYPVSINQIRLFKIGTLEPAPSLALKGQGRQNSPKHMELIAGAEAARGAPYKPHAFDCYGRVDEKWWKIGKQTVQYTSTLFVSITYYV